MVALIIFIILYVWFFMVDALARHSIISLYEYQEYTVKIVTYIFTFSLLVLLVLLLVLAADRRMSNKPPEFQPVKEQLYKKL